MGKIDLEKYRHNKKFEITLIILLSILAFFTIRNSILEIKDQQLGDLQWTIQDNVQKIGDDNAKLELNLSKLSSLELAGNKEKDLQKISQQDRKILTDCNLIVQDIMASYLENIEIYSEKFHDPQTAQSKLDELKSVIEKNKYIHDYDKILIEIENTYKKVSTPEK